VTGLIQRAAGIGVWREQKREMGRVTLGKSWQNQMIIELKTDGSSQE
jgi:hypothetical protein